MAETIVEVENVHFSYAKDPVLAGMSLSLCQGEIFGFVGPNGAGKTTMIKMLLGLLTPTSGSIDVFGHTLKDNRALIMRQVGSLVETPSFYPNLTAYENLAIQATVHGLPKGRCLDALSLLGLEGARDKRLKHFSLGMKQRLGLAMALLHQPKLLILDEPSNGLDPVGIQQLRRILKSLSEREGITVFLSSHILAELEQIITRLAIINNGKSYYQGSMANLKAGSVGELRLGVDQPDKTLLILQHNGHKGTLNRQNEILVRIADESIVSVINHLLVSKGIAVSKLIYEQPNLEQIFLTTIGHETAGGAA